MEKIANRMYAGLKYIERWNQFSERILAVTLNLATIYSKLGIVRLANIWFQYYTFLIFMGLQTPSIYVIYFPYVSCHKTRVVFDTLELFTGTDVLCYSVCIS